MRRLAALLLASNGPGTLLPWRFCCGQVLWKNRWTANDRTSSGTQMCCGAGDWSDCTARWQAIGGRRIKHNAGHERVSIPGAEHLSRRSFSNGKRARHVHNLGHGASIAVIGQTLCFLHRASPDELHEYELLPLMARITLTFVNTMKPYLSSFCWLQPSVYS